MPGKASSNYAKWQAVKKKKAAQPAPQKPKSAWKKGASK